MGLGVSVLSSIFLRILTGVVFELVNEKRWKYVGIVFNWGGLSSQCASNSLGIYRRSRIRKYFMSARERRNEYILLFVLNEYA